MTNSWLPPWLGWLWVAGLAVVAVVHARHLVRLPDVTRVWHGGHVLMSLGMVAMFWPGGLLLEAPSGVVGRTVFTLLALAAATWSVVDRARRGRWTLVWPLLTVNLATMVWMFVTMAPVGGAGMAAGAMAGGSTSAGAMSAGPPPVDAVLGAWFVLEALGWATGRLVRASERDLHLELPLAARTEVVPSLADGVSHARSAGGSSDGRGRAAARGGQAPGATSPGATSPGATSRGAADEAPPHAWHGRSLRVTLTIMSASMAFMLLAMAFGGAMAMPGT